MMTDEFVIQRKVTSPEIFGQKNAAVFSELTENKNCLFFETKNRQLVSAAADTASVNFSVGQIWPNVDSMKLKSN